MASGHGSKTREGLRGTRNPNAVLTPEQVLTIRRRYAEGVTQGALCRVYGVSIGTIERVIHFKTWAWLTEDHPLAVSPNAPRDDAPPKLSPEAEAQLERDAAASAERLKALLAQDTTPAQDSGNRPFVYIPIHKQEPKG